MENEEMNEMQEIGETNDSDHLKIDNSDDALNPLEEGSYIKKPKVGEMIEIHVKKYVKVRGQELVRKDENGKEFSLALPKQDFAYQYVVYSGERFTGNAWALVAPLNNALRIHAQRMQSKGSLDINDLDAKVKIHHVRDGFLKENKEKGVILYEVDLFNVDANVWERYNQKTKQMEPISS